jgi:hypothetical protein
MGKDGREDEKRIQMETRNTILNNSTVKNDGRRADALFTSGCMKREEVRSEEEEGGRGK